MSIYAAEELFTLVKVRMGGFDWLSRSNRVLGEDLMSTDSMHHNVLYQFIEYSIKTIYYR